MAKGGGFGRKGIQPAGSKPKNTKGTTLRILGYFKNNYVLIAIVLICLVASTLCQLLSSYLLKPIIDDYIVPGDINGLAIALVIFALVCIGASVFSYLQSNLLIRLSHKTVTAIRMQLFTKLEALPIKYFDTHTHGELMSRFTNDMDNILMALEQGIVQLFMGVIMLIGTFIFMLALSPLLTIITCATLAVMMFLASYIARKSQKYFKIQQKALGKTNGFIEEMIEGQKVVKVFNREVQAVDEFYEKADELREAATKAQFYSGVIMPVMGNLNNINFALTAVFGGLLSISYGFSIGSLVTFLNFSRQFGQPITQIANTINAVLAALAGAERVFEVMDAEPESDDGTVELVNVINDGDSIKECEKSTGRWAWKDGDTLIELKGDVRFEGVHFGYNDEKLVLKDVNLFAKPGQKIAFVGSTGAGKTTITNLINRFYDIQSGVISYDSIDIKRIKKPSLRRAMSMVLQDTHLFSGSVKENISYGAIDVPDEQIIRAAELAGADSFIRRLPDGYDTILSDDGAKLSQGQRQLLSIARTACVNPPVLILDEATSSIDTRTEKLVEKGMDSIMQGRTTFVIAHRLSTVRNSDCIMVLENGEIIERGNHDDLIAQKGHYYKLHTGQFELK